MPLLVRSKLDPLGIAPPRRSASAVRVPLLFAGVIASVVASNAACSSRSDLDRLDGTANAQLPAEERAAAREGDERGETGEPENMSIDPSTGCKVDDDCLRVEKGCCRLGKFVAISKAHARTYQEGLHCESVSCPLIMVVDDHSVAQCNTEKHICEVVLPRDIACNGFTTNPHTCPDGWHCKLPRGVADVPGVCVTFCGGFGNIQCTDSSDQCIDDPDDDCDPKKGGADCGGICVAAQGP